MKLYQIIMAVPDDFVPEEMTLSASSKFEVSVCSEGFIGPKSFVECETVCAQDEIEGLDAPSGAEAE